jgi:hypothetical protein
MIKWSITDGLRKTREEAVVAQSKALSRHFPRLTEVNHEKLLSVYPVEI